jgi:hypothetical protein
MAVKLAKNISRPVEIGLIILEILSIEEVES